MIFGCVLFEYNQISNLKEEDVFVKKPDYPEGSMLVDVRYYRKPECFEIIYLNPITNQLEVEYEDPIIDIWILKEEYRTNKYQITQVEMDKCYVINCKPSQVPKLIAKHIGGEWQQRYEQLREQNTSVYDMSREMCKCPWVFKADLLPDVYYRLKWLKKYGEDACDITKVTFSVLDIEVDVLDRTIDLKNIYDAPQPINAVSIILPHVKIAALLVLSPRPRHLIHEKFHELLSIQEKAYDWLTNNIDEFKHKVREYDEDNKKYLKEYDIRVHIFDFKDEINLIKTAFDYINKYRPMFVLSWNGKFDHNYLMQRIKYLGYEPGDIMIPKEFQTKQLWYKEDRDAKNFSMKNSKDWFFTSTYSTYICQMRLFAMIRKSQQERRSNSLSAVGKDVAGIDKLSSSEEGTFRVFAYKDFINFLLYNIRDVVVQLACELAVNDCQSLLARSYTFATQFSKCFQETHIVRGTREYFYEEDGIVQACTLIVEPGDYAFKGAFVANPLRNKPTGYILNGKKLNNILYGVLDADAKAYYPSSKMAYNLDPMSLIYKCRIDNENFILGKCYNRSLNQEYVWYDSKNRPHPEDMASPILNSYKNGNECGLLYNWLNIPSISDYFKYLDNALSMEVLK